MSFPLRPASIEIHEWGYLAQYLLYAVLLAAHGLAGTAAFFEMLVLTIGGLGVIYYSQRVPDLARRRLRWFYFVAVMGVSYQALGMEILKFRPDCAPLLQRADQWLLGGHAGVRLEPYSHPLLTEFLGWCYMGFFPYIAFGLWRHGWMAEAGAGLFFRTLGLIYSLGFIGYILCPAAGPYRDLAGEFPPLEGWRGTRLNDAMVAWGSNRVDCFPSLHCAVSGAILSFGARGKRALFLWQVPVVAGIWISTVYLRQHYFVDVLGGLALLTVASKLARRFQAEH